MGTSEERNTLPSFRTSSGRQGGWEEGRLKGALVLWLYAMLGLLQDAIEEDKGFPMHHST